MNKKIMISRKDWDDIVNNSAEDIDNKNSLKVPGRFSFDLPQKLCFMANYSQICSQNFYNQKLNPITNR